jgi:uncharacterized protein
MDFEGAKKYILDELVRSLKSTLWYHDFHHTVDVLESAERIATSEKLSHYEIILLKTACIFHDSGMLVTYNEHEEAGCEITRRILPEYNFDDYEIDTICKMIMATRLPQSANGKLEQIICDADLDYLGRNDFFMISHKLKFEWEVNQIKILSLKDWYHLQVEFLESHAYFTQTAIQTRTKGKLENLNQIKALQIL